MLDPDLGDTWAYYYKFELQHGTEVRTHTTFFPQKNYGTPQSPSVNLFHRNILKLLMALLRDDVIFSHRASLWRQIPLTSKRGLVLVQILLQTSLARIDNMTSL